MARKINKINNKINQTATLKKGSHIQSATYSKNKLFNNQNTNSNTDESLKSKKYHKPTSSISEVGRDIRKKIQNELNSTDDSGTATINQGINITVGTTNLFKTSQKAIPSIQKIAKGSYNIAGKTYEVVKTIDSTLGKIKTGQILLNAQTAAHIKTLAISKVINSRVIQKINSTSKNIKTGISTVNKYGLKAVNGTIKTFQVTKGIINGSVKVKLSKQQIQTLKSTTLRGIKLTGKSTLNATKKTLNTTKNIGKIAHKVTQQPIHYARNMISDTLSKSDNMGVQALNLGLKTPSAIIKTAKTSYSVVKTSAKISKMAIKAPIKTAKTLYIHGRQTRKVIQVVNKAGFKKAAKYFRPKVNKTIKKAVVNAGKNTIKIIFNFVFKKMIIPLIIMVVVVGLIYSLLTIPVMAVASFFSGFVTDKDSGNDIEEHTWLIDKVSTKRNDFINEIKEIYQDNKVSSGGKYHIIRLYNNVSGEEISIDDTNSILNSIYNTSEYVDLIEPIFHTIMLTEYDLEPTQAEMNKVFIEIWNELTKIKEEEKPTEYCNDVDTCGNRHANFDCPNPSELRHHSSYQCDTCCWYSYTTEEHETVINGVTTITTEEVRHDECNGYRVCQGHKVLSITIGTQGFDALLNKYFLNEINTLEAKSNRTEAEEERLKELRDNYEFCIEYNESLLGESNGVVVDTGDIEVNAITEYALQFVGNPYVWGGNSITNGTDCSGFVKLVYQHFGYNLPRYSGDQQHVGTEVSTISEALPGDLICYDGHIAIYLGNNKIVHASNSQPYPVGGIKVSNNAQYRTIVTIRRIIN